MTGLTEALAGVGVTTWVPTIVTTTEERIHHALGQVAAARAADPRVAAAVPFVHVEGPFISDQEGARGVHDPALVRPLDADEVARWLQGHDLVGVVTVSPHTADAPEQVRRVRTLGVDVSLGHTHATTDQLRAAVDAGATLATHLGNGIPSLLPRHPNAIWTLLAEDRVTAGVIADGHHLPAEVLTVALRAKGTDRLFIVSDSTALAGQPPGRYATPVGGQVDVGADGRLSFVGTDLLAGAGVDLAHGLRHLLTDLGLDWASALALATATPARVVAQTRLGRRGMPVGRLEPGHRADLVLLAPDGPDRGPGRRRGRRRRTGGQPGVTGPAHPLAAGAAVAAVDVPVGTPLSGYAAREGGATGTHDPCTARALAVEDTCWVAVDVCGLDRATCAAVAERVGLPDGHLLVTATHTHSGPACTPGRLGGDDPVVRQRVVDAAVDAATQALAARRPVRLWWSSVRGAGVAVDRRTPSRPVDPPVDLLRFVAEDGAVVGWLVSYPCHPVVLAADNRLGLRGLRVGAPRRARGRGARVGRRLPAGDVWRPQQRPRRGGVLHLGPAGGSDVRGGRADRPAPRPDARWPVRRPSSTPAVPSRCARRRSSSRWPRSTRSPLRRWPSAGPPSSPDAEPGRAALLRAWVDWARQRSAADPTCVRRAGHRRALGWAVAGRAPGGAVPLLRRRRSGSGSRGRCVVTGYTGDCPGYLPDAEAYAHGGYEVTDAHRYYGMPAPFARGSAERLLEVAVDLVSGP